MEVTQRNETPEEAQMMNLNIQTETDRIEVSISQPATPSPGTAIVPPEFQSNSAFWTIVALTVLVKAVLGRSGTR